MSKASYLQLEPGEEIVLVRYRHIINLVPFLVSTVLVLLVLPTVGVWLSANQKNIPVPIGIIHTGLSILGVVAVVTFLAAVFIFLQNRIVLTNKHYMQIDQLGLFNRTVSKLQLGDIQDVRGTRKGVLATLLGYGEILIETAGEEENFLFKPVSDPLNLAEAINDHRQQHRQSKANNPV